MTGAPTGGHVRIAMAGAGPIGRRHVDEVVAWTSAPARGRHSHPLVRQVEDSAAVVRGEVEPVCRGRGGPVTLQVVDVVLESAAAGRPVDLPAVATGRPRLRGSPPT